jgi:PAS domain S-box-containing protein
MSENGSKGRTLVNRLYYPRIVGLGLGFFCVASVFLQKETHALAWLGLIANGFLWPHLAYVISKTSRNPHKAERRNLLIDSFLGGIWVPLMAFNILPSATIIFMLSMDNISVGGLRLFAKGALAQLMGCFLAILFFGLNIQPESTMLNILACLPMLGIYPLSIGIITYRFAKELSEQKKEIEKINIEIKNSNVELTAAYEGVRESEERYRHLVKHAPAGIYEVDFTTRKLLSVNDAMCQYTGYSKEEFLSLDPIQLHTEQSLKSFIQRHANILAGEPVPDNIEYQLKRKDGSEFWVLFNNRYSHGPNNTIIATVIAHDITERKLAEEAVRESEEKYRTILENIEEGYHEVNIAGSFTFFNDSFRRMMGYSREELMGMNYKQYAADDENSRNILRAYNTVYRTGEPLTRFEWDIIRKDGVRRSLEVSASLIKDSSGNSQGFRGIVTDITERKRAEDALRESEARYKSIIENIVDVYYRTDKDGNLIMLSPSGRAMSGYDSVDELIGKNISDTFYFNPEERKRFVSALQEKGSVTDFEVTLKRKDETPIPVSTSSRYYYDEKGDILGIEGIFRDITERKQADKEKRSLEERLQRAEKMETLGTLAGGVAHDLNNVLGIVVGYAEMLLMDEDKSSSIRPDLLNIMDAGQRAAAIVQDLLTLARRGVVSSRKVLNLNRIIADSQKSPEFEKLSSYHPSAKITTDLDPKLLNISGSSVHLGKALFNLVSNASEAMPGGGILTIKTANRYLDKPIHGYEDIREGDYVILSVSDTGEGISATDQKHIFEPFYTKKVMGRSGTGLGLAVVWGTVKDHNGYINVESEEGKGSTFSLYFPASSEDISPEAVAVSISKYVGKGESILIVDDIRGQRDLAAGMLRKLNYKVASVGSGEEAVVYMKENNVDLMVLDMIMDPGMDGLDTYRRVLEINQKQKAIIVSGFSETDRVHAAQAVGAGAYVRKPYVIEKLGLAVKKELERAA